MLGDTGVDMHSYVLISSLARRSVSHLRSSKQAESIIWYTGEVKIVHVTGTAPRGGHTLIGRFVPRQGWRDRWMLTFR